MYESIVGGARARAKILALFVGSIWLVSLANFILPLHLELLGVRPRQLLGLIGFVVAPWVHAGIGHLLSNTVPLLVLGWLAMWPRVDCFWRAVLGSMVGAGAAAWVLGSSNSSHIGASGVVFGLCGYILARGYYSRQIVTIAIALLAAFLYGFSMLKGVLPLFPGVSWQSHLGGFIGGFIAARLTHARYTSPGQPSF